MLTDICKFGFYVCLGCAFIQAAIAQQCDPGIIESKAQSLALLEQEQHLRERPECITRALYGVRGSHSEKLAEILVKYLDFKRPFTAGEQKGIRREPVVGEAGMYPAVASLALVGELAIPNLISAMSNGLKDELSRRNALLAFMEIHRHDQPKAVATLKAEAQNESMNASERLLLVNAAREAVGLCSNLAREACLKQFE